MALDAVRGFHRNLGTGKSLSFVSYSKEVAVQVRRRIFLKVPWLLLLSSLASAQSGPLDVVAVYMVPLDDFPSELAEALAKALQQKLNLRIKASIPLPPLSLTTLPGTNQYAGDDIIVQGAKASARLPEMSQTTFRLFLTGKDINTKSGNFRFQFSAHSKLLNCSVISLARLLEYSNGRPVFTQMTVTRLIKLSLRAIGELQFGWVRSTNPEDVMYSPLMTRDDLDRMGFDHTEKSPEESPNVQEPKPAEGSV
jgi:predicted Zn-dependent protease